MKMTKTSIMHYLKSMKGLLALSLFLACFVGNYTAASGCNANFSIYYRYGLTLYFSDTSTFSSGSGTYYWTFGDGDSLQTNYGYTSHTYSGVGNYNICLKVVDSNGSCTNSYCQTVKVGGCNAYISGYYSYAPLTYFFNADSNYFASGNGTYIWRFGDGDSVVQANYSYVYHNYAKTGTYKVCLTVKDSNGSCTATSCDSVVVQMVCDAGFYGYPNKLTVPFYETNSDTILKDKWYFGDGDSAIGTNPTHTYASPGTYRVIHIVYCHSCISSDTVSYTLSRCSPYSFYQTVYDGRTVQLTAYDTSGISYTWHFGDGTTGTGRIVNHVFKAGGNDSLFDQTTLSVVDTYYSSALGTMTTDTCISSSTIYVTNCYNAYYSYTTHFKTISATAQSNPLNPNVKLHWSWGDGTTDTGLTATHTYANIGYYSVTLKVLDSACNDSETQLVSVGVYSIYGDVVLYAPPADTIKIASGYVYLVQYDSSTSTFVSIKSRHFNDTANSTYAYVPYEFDTIPVGHYWVFAALDNLSDTFTYNHFLPTWGDSSIIWPNANIIIITDSSYPYAYEYIFMKRGHNTGGWSFAPIPTDCNASFTETINKYQVSFFPLNTNYSYHWNFGDGSTSTSAQPVHTYSTKGYFIVTLTVSDSAGYCSDSISHSVQIGNYSLTAYVITSNDSTSYKSGNIYIAQYNTTDSTLNLVKQAHFSTNSAYYAYYNDSLDMGTYLVKAAYDSLSDTAIYHHYVPTYATTSLRWDSAANIMINSTPKTAYVSMRYGVNRGGPGFISGKVAQGANKKGDPITGLEVMLLDSATQNPVGYMYSNNSGRYTFSNLAYGTYELYGEVLGVKPVPAYIKISAKVNTYVTSVALNKDSVVASILSTSVTSGIENAKPLGVNGYTVYPNPAGDYVNISFTNATNDRMALTLFDVTGNVVLSETASGQGQQLMQVNTANLVSGMYIIELKNAVNGAISHSSLMIAH